MSTSIRILRRSLLGVVVALIFSATVGTPAHALDKVSLRLEWVWWIGHAGFFIPVEKGWYAQSGLDVSINQGKGSISTALLVSQGTETFGLGDAGAVARVDTEGAHLKSVAVFWQSAPYGIVCRPEVGLKSPADLGGTTIGSSTNAAEGQLLAAFIDLNKLPKDKIQIINMPAESKVAALLSGQVKCISTDIYLTEDALAKTSLKVDAMLYSDHDVRSLSNAIMVNDDYLAKNPDIVRRFLAVVSRGYQYMLDNPDEAIAILHKYAPDAILNVDFSKMYIDIMKKQAHTPASQGKPLGWSAESDWAALLHLLTTYGGLEHAKAPTTYFTNDYLPKG
jgi:NitT/TauT family transport system substrate-binding protein